MSPIVSCIFVIGVLLNFMPSQEVTKTYSLNKIKKPIHITGKGDDPSWKKAALLTEFIYPWEKEIPPYTAFKGLHDDNWVYFFFDVLDSNINIYMKSNGEQGAVRSDRVEVFFKQDDAMNPYYSLEIDPLARVFDSKGVHYHKVDRQWSWPQGELEIKSHQHETGYSVEMRISKRSLEELGLLQNNRLYAGLFRADCYEMNDNHSEYRWISWIDPKSSDPDFHISSAFGKLDLISK